MPTAAGASGIGEEFQKVIFAEWEHKAAQEDWRRSIRRSPDPVPRPVPPSDVEPEVDGIGFGFPMSRARKAHLRRRELWRRQRRGQADERGWSVPLVEMMARWVDCALLVVVWSPQLRRSE